MTDTDRPDALAPAEARELFRGGLRVPTSGWCAGWTQANLLAVPRDLAYDFLLFAQRNPAACPVLDVTEPGAVSSPRFAGDLRTDLPAYRIYEHGELVDEVDDVTARWRDDMVAFLIGCSFTFEDALLAAGVPVRHIEQGSNVPMYRTDVACRPAGSLSGPLVVSMRPMAASQVATAVRVTSRYPAVHGAPVHIGLARRARHHRPRRPRLRGPRRGAAGRGPGLLGLRGDPAGGGHAVPPGPGDRPRSRAHGHHRHPRERARRPVTGPAWVRPGSRPWGPRPRAR